MWYVVGGGLGDFEDLGRVMKLWNSGWLTKWRSSGKTKVNYNKN
jgi:hypothetical protein